MSMLAERKRREKWSLNPRGKYWSEDQNKFGQKMLEKMGWSKGKGLGANLHGITEHIRVSYKNDQNGIGYKARDDQWTEHQDSFNELLKNLSAGSGDIGSEIKIKSLEEKSKVSKARVHYAKFTRGKDLSRASAKDLANIFGKKTLTNCKEAKEMDNEQPKEESFARNGGNMFDYFKKKLPGFRKNGYVTGNNGVLKKESDSEDEVRGGFGFSAANNRAGFGFGYPSASAGGFGNEENCFTNSFLNNPITQVKKHVVNGIEEREEENAKENMNGAEKKSGNKRNSVGALDVDKIVNDSSGNKKKKFKGNIEESRIEESTENIVTQKAKKKKKLRTEQFPEDPLCGEQLNACEVVRKKKNKTRAVAEQVNEETLVDRNVSFEEESGIVDNEDTVVQNSNEVQNKRSKRRRDDEDSSNELTVKTKKKKKKFSIMENTTVNDSRNNNDEVVRKKKKKQKTSLEI